MPAEAGIYACEEGPLSPRSVAVVMPEFINNNPAWIDHDFRIHVSRSAAEAGHRVSEHYADAITYEGCDNPADELARFEGFLDTTRPELVVIEANYLPSGRTIRPKLLERLKRKFGFKVMAMFSDCYDLHRDYLGVWAETADLSIVFNQYTRHYRNFADKRKILVCPSLPHHAPTLAPMANRDIDLSFVGSDTRHRRLFLEAAAAAGVKTLCRFHNRLRSNTPTLEEFARILGSSKLSFNNGWVTNGEMIITARVSEIILAGGVLLEEAGAPIDDYLVPFVHYVPVDNIHQFVAYSKFLLEDDERRAKIAGEARRFWMEHYSSNRFWRRVDRILFSGEVGSRAA